MSGRRQGRKKSLDLIRHLQSIFYEYFVRNNADSLILKAKPLIEAVKKAEIKLEPSTISIKCRRGKVHTVRFLSIDVEVK